MLLRGNVRAYIQNSCIGLVLLSDFLWVHFLINGLKFGHETIEALGPLFYKICFRLMTSFPSWTACGTFWPSWQGRPTPDRQSPCQAGSSVSHSGPSSFWCWRSSRRICVSFRVYFHSTLKRRKCGIWTRIVRAIDTKKLPQSSFTEKVQFLKLTQKVSK